jgi:hypothetical protein
MRRQLDNSETLHLVCQTKEHGVTVAEESNVLSFGASVSTFFFASSSFPSSSPSSF